MATSQRQIVIVDDDLDTCVALRDALEEEGYGVHTFPTGPEAIEFLRAGHSACLILVDMLMPVMSGAELCAELERDPFLARIPVVTITVSRKAFAQGVTGAVGSLMKPLEMSALLLTVAQHCRPIETH